MVVVVVGCNEVMVGVVVDGGGSTVVGSGVTVVLVRSSVMRGSVPIASVC